MSGRTLSSEAYNLKVNNLNKIENYSDQARVNITLSLKLIHTAAKALYMFLFSILSSICLFKLDNVMAATSIPFPLFSYDMDPFSPDWA